MTPWGIDLKVALVCALPRFRYFNYWFCFKGTRNFSSLSCQNISVSRYGSTFSQLIVMFFFLDVEVMNPSTFQISTVNCRCSDSVRKLTRV